MRAQNESWLVQISPVSLYCTSFFISFNRYVRLSSKRSEAGLCHWLRARKGRKDGDQPLKNCSARQVVVIRRAMQCLPRLLHDSRASVCCMILSLLLQTVSSSKSRTFAGTYSAHACLVLALLRLPYLLLLSGGTADKNVSRNNNG